MDRSGRLLLLPACGNEEPDVARDHQTTRKYSRSAALCAHSSFGHSECGPGARDLSRGAERRIGRSYEWPTVKDEQGRLAKPARGQPYIKSARYRQRGFLTPSRKY